MSNKCEKCGFECQDDETFWINDPDSCYCVDCFDKWVHIKIKELESENTTLKQTANDLGEKAVQYYHEIEKLKSQLAFRGWIPTIDNVNSLPEPIRKYIHDLETNADPAGMVMENTVLADNIKGLEAQFTTLNDIKQYHEEICPETDAENKALHEKLAESDKLRAMFQGRTIQLKKDIATLKDEMQEDSDSFDDIEMYKNELEKKLAEKDKEFEWAFRMNEINALKKVKEIVNGWNVTRITSVSYVIKRKLEDVLKNI